MTAEMTSREYDLIFVGGGLAALLLLQELRTVLPARVAVVDPRLLHERSPVHWRYWSHEHSLYDRFATGVWRKARVADMPPESIAPFALRLVRSTDVFSYADGLLGSAPIEWLRTTARSIAGLADGLYEILTDAGTLRAHWVFDSAPDVPPVFPPPETPRGVERHGHPCRGRQAGLRRGDRDPLRPAGRDLLSLPAAVESRRGATRVRFFRSCGPGGGSDGSPSVPPGTPSWGQILGHPRRERFYPTRVRASQNHRPPTHSARHEARPDQAQCRLRGCSYRR
jgi:Lycopene cyclase protein